MLEAPVPRNEAERLAALKKINILDTEPEERFDRITKFAQRLFQVPISTISLIDTNREWFKSCQGLGVQEGGRDISFCGHATLEDDLFVIPDTQKDERFKDNPMVVGKPYIRFYAGQSLKGPGGHNIGTFCIKDLKPRELSSEDAKNLKELAAWTEIELNMYDLVRVSQERDVILKQLEKRNEELEKINKVMVNRELRMAELKKEVNTLSENLGRGRVYGDN